MGLASDGLAGYVRQGMVGCSLRVSVGSLVCADTGRGGAERVGLGPKLGHLELKAHIG